MKQEKNNFIRKWGILAFDILTILISFIIAYNLRFYNNPTYDSQLEYAVFFCIILCFVAIFFNYSYADNSLLFYRNGYEELKIVVSYSFLLSVSLIVVSYVINQSEMLARSIILYFFIVNVLLMLLGRTLLKTIFKRIYDNSSYASSVVIITERGYEKSTISSFNSGLTYHLIGLLTMENDVIKGVIDGTPVKGTWEEILNKLVLFQVDDVMLNLPNENESTITKLIHGFEEMGVVCHYVLVLPKNIEEDGKIGEFGEIPVISYELAEHSALKLTIKRIFDIFISLIGLVICGIIGLVLVPLIKIESPGPAIFSQIRIGKNGRKFKFYKFRSMYADAEERKSELVEKNQIDGLMFKIDDDPRITKVGKFIRKTSLDEFPQFWNVLKGDMSVIGTRPPTEDEFENYSPYYKGRLSMTPGITGLWQISGRSDIKNFDDVVKMDLYYINNWSLTLDFEIFIKTIGVVLKKKGAS